MNTMPTADASRGGQGTECPHQSLTRHMKNQYWRIARRRRVLNFISQIFRDDLVVYPLQYQESIGHLVALRRAARRASAFYSGLDPQSMKHIRPWGTIAKLADFESQVTELLLFVAAMQEASAKSHIFLRVQIHVVIHQLFPCVLTAFDDVISQLHALLEKAEGLPCNEGGRA